METLVNLDQVIDKISAQGNEVAQHLHWWQHPQYTNLLQPIEKEVDEFLIQVTKDLDEEKIEKLIGVIRGRRDKLPLSTGITDQIIGICKQILAFGAAGIALAVGFAGKATQFPVGIQKALAIGGIWYGELILLSLIVLVWYMLQARFRYPFLYLKTIGNAWPWFYYASVSSNVSRSPVQTPRKRMEASVQYAVDFLRFTNKCLEEEPRERLRTEVQQYFLLMAYMGYVHQFSLRLTNLFFYGLTGSVATVILLGVCSAWGVI